MTENSAFENMTADQQIESLGDVVAEILAQYELGPHNAECINHDLNSTFADVDDSGIGLPVQDLATSLYYLDNDEQVAAFLAGYSG